MFAEVTVAVAREVPKFQVFLSLDGIFVLLNELFDSSSVTRRAICFPL